MRFGCIPAAALCLSMVACGGGDDGVVADATSRIDADPSCRAWELNDVGARSLSLLGTAPAVAGRTVRVAVEASGEIPCESLAMMSVVYTPEKELVAITPRVWREIDCVSEEFNDPIRPVVLDALHAGTWTITAPGADDLVVEVAPAPGACDPGRDPCQLDCDCDVDAGERCLSYDSFVGPATMCARPCELDRDCNGTGCDRMVTDGLGYACNSEPECGPCPDGWTCAAGACAPDFTLGQGTRRACSCDADCEPGMRCTESSDGAERRCEATCATGGAWCQGAHVCGSIDDDLAGLAVTDAVCGWLGE